MSSIIENLKATGKLTITVLDSAGKLKEERVLDNLVVTTGKNYIASRMTGTTPAVMSHMAIGSNATAAAASDTQLGSELGRVALTSGSTTNNVTTYTATFPAGTGTGAVTEAGMFNSAATGTMLCRTVFSVVNKGASDSMTVNWTVTIN